MPKKPFRSWLRSLFPGRYKAAPAKRNRLRLEPLETRNLLTTTVYVDFGDRFLGGTFSVTNRDFLAPAINGNDFTGVGNDETLNFTTFAAAASVIDYNGDGTANAADATDLRVATLALMRRYYGPFDIDVIELTATPQMVNGNPVMAARTLADVAAALNANDATAERNDSYVFAVGVTTSATATIVDVDTANDTFTVSGDYRSVRGRQFTVTGSTGNNGAYTARSFAYDPGTNRTTIEVNQNVTDATADGQVVFSDAIATLSPGLNGQAGGPDIGNANVSDDTAVAIIPHILDDASGTPRTADTRLGYTLTHEAAHTLSLQHLWNGESQGIGLTNDGAAGSGSFEVFGNITESLVVGNTVTVNAVHNPNDGTYTIRAGSSYNPVTARTTINVAEAVAAPAMNSDGGSVEFDYVTDSLLTIRSDLIPGSVGETNRVNFSFFSRYSLPTDSSLGADLAGVTPGAAGAGSFRVVSDLTTVMSAGTTFAVSAANGTGAALFTVQSISFNTATQVTTIVPVEAIPVGTTAAVIRVARQDAATQLLTDPNIGPKPGGPAYVTGTGAFDEITITRVNSTTANVAVRAHRDNSYANLIGTATYQINTTNGILIDAGFSDDRITLDATLGVTVTVRGNAGQDNLVIQGGGAASGTYTPAATETNGLDDNDDYRGTVAFTNGTTIAFQEFETTSSITVQNVTSLTLRTPGGVDALSIEGFFSMTSVVGTVAGGTDFVPILFTGVTNFTIDAGNGDGAASDDQITVASSFAASAGLQNFTINTGEGADTLILVKDAVALPVAGGAFTFNAGNGTDTIDNSTGTVNAWSITGSGSGSLDSILSFTGVQNLLGSGDRDTFAFGASGSLTGTVNGRGDGDTIDLSARSSATVTLSALGGVDGFNLSAGVALGQNINSVIGSSAGTSDSLTGIDDVAAFNVSNTGNSYVSTNTLAFSGFETLRGGSSLDVYAVSNFTGSVILDGRGFNDSYTITLSGIAGSTTIADSGTTTNDRATIDGTANADAFVTTATSTVVGLEGVNYDANLETLNVNGNATADTFDVTASASTAINVDGGAPTTSPGDALTYRGTGVANLSFNGPGSGTITQAGLQPVTYVSIEECLDFVGVTVNVTVDAGPAANDGNPDTFTIRRNGDDLQIFVNDDSVEAGCLEFDDVASLTINGSGDDDTLNLDNSGGYLNRIFNFNAAGGSNTLNVYGDPGVPLARETHIYDSVNSGRIIFDADDSAGAGTNGTLGDDVEQINYNGVQKVNDVKPAARLDVYLIPNAASTASLTDGAGFMLFVTAQLSGDGATTDFANKPVVSINGRSMADNLTINNPSGANALTALELYGHIQPDDPNNAPDTAADTFAFIASDVPIRADGQGGDDVFNVLAATKAITLNGGDGGDTFNVSSDAPANLGSLANLQALVTINGDGGVNAAFVSDVGRTGAGLGTLSDMQLTGFGMSGGITYAGLSALTLSLGNNASGDTLNVTNTHAGTTTIDGNAGADTIEVAATTGATTINAGAGFDTVNVGTDLSKIAGALVANGDADQAVSNVSNLTGAAGTGSLTLNSLIGYGMGVGITYSSMATLTLDLSDSAGADTLAVLSTHAGQTNVRGNGGADTVNVGTAGSLDPLGGPLDFDGGAASDTLNLNDNADATANTYGLTSTQFTRQDGKVVTYSALEFFNLFGGVAGNQYNVASTGAATQTTIEDGNAASGFTIQGDGLTAANLFEGNGGGDVYVVNAGLGVTGTAVTLDGGTGPDRVTFNARAGADNLDLGITSSAGDHVLSGMGQAITSLSVEDVTIDGNGGANALSIGDRTNTVYGAALSIEQGMIFRPTGAETGEFYLANRTLSPVVHFTGVNGDFSVNGDTDGSGDRDTLTVLSTSTVGLVSLLGELTSADGSDWIDVSDTKVSIVNNTLGQLRSVTLAQTGGQVTFKDLIVRAGSEPGVVGGVVRAVPSNRLNLFIDGMDPVSGDPGDKLDVQTVGARTLVRSRAPEFGAVHTRIVQTADGASVGWTHFEEIVRVGVTAVAQGAGPHAPVIVRDVTTGETRFALDPYPGFGGSVRVAVGDLNGDAIPDIVTSVGGFGPARVIAFDGVEGTVIHSFIAFPGYLGGVAVGIGDVNGDGVGEIAIGAGLGTRPHVMAHSGDNLAVVASYFAFAPGFLGGLNLSVGYVDGDGMADVAVGPANVDSSHVRIISGALRNAVNPDGEISSAAELASFFAFGPTYRGGITVALGDLDGDRKADVIIGAGNASVPRVLALSLSRGTLADFQLHDPAAPAATGSIPTESGVRVGAADMNNDGIEDIVLTKGDSFQPILFAYEDAPLGVLTQILVFDGPFSNGLWVAGSK